MVCFPDCPEIRRLILLQPEFEWDVKHPVLSRQPPPFGFDPFGCKAIEDGVLGAVLDFDFGRQAALAYFDVQHDLALRMHIQRLPRVVASGRPWKSSGLAAGNECSGPWRRLVCRWRR